MTASIVSREDLNYLAQQSSRNLNMILSGMTALMNDTDSKVSMMENQTWFQRMCRTISGKNKMTQQEIQRNHDKINMYMSQAMTELFEQQCIDRQIMISLGTQINEIYAEHIHLKQMLGAFVTKLNEKIESIDNFHMLNTEIEQGVYSKKNSLFSICNILAQFDNRILNETRKIDIIKRSMQTQNIINDTDIDFTTYLMNIIDAHIDDIGLLYMELSGLKGNFIADILIDTIESYHFLPELTRKLKNKRIVLNEIIQKYGLDDSVQLSSSYIFDELLKTKIDKKDFLIIEHIDDVSSDNEDMTPLDNINDEISDIYEAFLNYRINMTFQLCEDLVNSGTGNGRAMYLLGKIYAKGYGDVVEDREQAIYWFKKGYEAGDILATISYTDYLPSNSPEKEKLYTDTFPKVLKLAESNDILAQYELLWLYEYGQGTSKNRHSAFSWAKKCSDNGHWAAMYRLAYYYETGIGCEKDVYKAFEYYKKSADIGYGDAMDSLGICYRNGTGVSKNNSKGFEWYMNAANAGSKWGMYHVGKCYLWGIGCSEDSHKSHIWCEKAANKGHVNAMVLVGYDYRHGPLNCNRINADYNKAFYWFNKAANLGDGRAQGLLADCYEYGIGTAENHKKAEEWWAKAKAQGFGPYGCSPSYD